LRERADERAQTMLLLLATLSNDDRYAVVGRLIGRSPHGRSRAVLLEALEALLPPEQRVRVMPLLDDDDAVAATAAADALGRAPLAFADAVREILAGSDALTISFLSESLDPRRLAAGADAEDTAEDEAAEPHDVMNRVEICLHLRNLELFAGLTTRQLSEIADGVHEEVYPIGAAIVREGEFGDCMYVIVEGEVRLTREGEVVSHFKPGEFLGEMAVFDGEARYATATAITRVRLLRLQRNDLLRLMDEQPSIAISVCQQLSRHVRDLIHQVEGRAAKPGGRV